MWLWKLTHCTIVQGQLDPATAFISGGNASQRNIVNIWNHQYVENDVTDGQTATLTVYPSEASADGNVNFKFYNINFENRAVSLPPSSTDFCSR